MVGCECYVVWLLLIWVGRVRRRVVVGKGLERRFWGLGRKIMRSAQGRASFSVVYINLLSLSLIVKQGKQGGLFRSLRDYGWFGLRIAKILHIKTTLPSHSY